VIFVANVGTGLLLVDASDEDHCRKALAKRLGYAHKPWIANRIEVRVATDEDQSLLKALDAKVWKAPKLEDPTKGKAR
jgi:hypothetical protein